MLSELGTRYPALEAMCRRHGVRRLELFGSAVSGTFRCGESDLDFLVEFQRRDAPGYADAAFHVKNEP